MKQEQAMAWLTSGQNVFLTGSAGSGKTHVLNQYIKYLKDRKVQVAVTASTGIAATHMNGMTIHAWSGIGIKDQLNRKQLLNLKSKKYLSKNLDEVKVLIIDEISMLHQRQLSLINQVLQFFKESDEAFGGVQVIFCGDFFQLPPIGNQGEGSREKFAFMSPAWLSANLVVCYLTEQHRQEDPDLDQILNGIRKGTLAQEELKKLLNAQHNQLPKGQVITQLFTHNEDVDKINALELEKLPGRVKTFRAETSGNEKLVGSLSKSVLAPEHLSLKIDAKVMFVRNNPEKDYVNGSLGTIIGFSDEGLPSVKMINGKTIIVEPEDWKINDDGGKELANYTQIPLRLAWAITVHKSQGMTLEAATIDLSKTFETGQGYVALSRLKKLSQLQLLGMNEQALKVDPLAFKADQRFKALSEEASNAINPILLLEKAKQFIKNCGGLTSESAIEKHKAKRKEKSKLKKGKREKSESTYAITLMYLEQGRSIKEIAKDRGMTEGTIAAHLIKIKKDNPKANLSAYKPKKKIVDQVKHHYELMDKKDGLSLKVLYERLDKKVSYTDIKLALAFIV